MAERETAGTAYALDAEQAIIAALFGESAPEFFDRLTLVVKAEEFYFKAHGQVFEAYSRLVEEGVTPDPATLSSRIKSSFTVDDETRRVLAEAASYPYVPENIEAYGRLVADKATARRVASGLAGVIKKAGLVGGEITASELLREVEAVAQAEERDAVENQILRPIDVPLAKTLDWLDRRGKGELTGLLTGLRDLDEHLNGIDDNDLVIVAGRPSMGKSVLAMNIALHVAERDDAPLVPFFSLEMGDEQLMLRCFSHLGSIDHDKLRRAALTDDDYDLLGGALGRMSGMSLRIDCDPMLSPSILRAKLRLLLRHNKGKRIGAILVDYLQLMEPDRQLNNKATEVAEISRALKRVAKEFGAPVFALSQLNRGVEQRPNKRPVMSDLRESGGIEQDADTIMMLYRDEYYNPDSDQKGVAEIILPKVRNGKTGTVPAAFLGEYQRFANLAFGAYTS